MKLQEYRIVLDQSTSGTKALLVDTSINIKILDRMDLPHKQIYPQKGWVEHDPKEIIKNVETLIDSIIEENGLDYQDVKSISLTNQRESVLVWDRKTGEPYTNVMVWQCNRGLDICKDLEQKGYKHVIQEKTGLMLDPYFSGTKLKWFFDQNQLTENQIRNLGIGTIDTWVIWNLTHGEKYISDISNACRTLLFNIKTEQWDEELTSIFHVPFTALPEVKDSVSDFGEYKGIPIISIVADSQAALYGHMCVNPGDAKATLGTGCSVMMNIGNTIDKVGENIVTTIAWKEEEKTTYAFEGVIRSFGDVLNWLKDSLHLFDDVQTASDEVFQLENNGGVFFVPALEGLGAPFWMPEVEASFVGMSRNTTKLHLIRAGFESMAYQIRAVVDEFEHSCTTKLESLCVDGGASKNADFMQMLADITRKPILCGEIEEISAMGTLAIIGKSISQEKLVSKTYLPKNDYERCYQEWVQIINNKMEE